MPRKVVHTELVKYLNISQILEKKNHALPPNPSALAFHLLFLCANPVSTGNRTNSSSQLLLDYLKVVDMPRKVVHTELVKYLNICQILEKLMIR